MNLYFCLIHLSIINFHVSFFLKLLHLQPTPNPYLMFLLHLLSLCLCGHRPVHQGPISILLAQTSWAVWVQWPEVGEHVPGFGLNAVLIIGLSSDP